MSSNATWISLTGVLCWLLVASARAQTVVDYNHRSLDCEWLASEYQRILDYNERESVKPELSDTHIWLLVLTSPMRMWDFILGDAAPTYQATDIQGEVRFSGAVNDVMQTGLKKECFALVRKMESDQRERGNASLAPAVVVSSFDAD